MQSSIDKVLIFIRLSNIDDVILCTYLMGKEDIYNFCEAYEIDTVTSGYTTPFDLEICFFNIDNRELLCLCHHILVDKDRKRLMRNVNFYLLNYLKDIT